MNDIDALGIAWYKLEDYDAILRIMADSDKLPDTFSEWRMKAEQREKLERRNGKVVVRVLIDPETFPDWCRSRSLNVDAKARMLYASLIAKRTIERSNGESSGIH
jgi:hypothetical protein